MVNVAIFPIPNAVSFPGVPCPLHVFEPRYRQMVRHCIDEELLLGVCHTEKLLHNHDREQTVEEALNSNQSTYKPRDVFSAGPVEILQELADGRLLIQVDMQVRLQLREERQTLPFSIWACEELADEPIGPQGARALGQSKDKILHRLIAITHQSPKIQSLLKSEYWQAMTPQQFSFAVSGMLGLETELAQQLLQTTDTQQRLDAVLDVINGMS